MSADISIYPVPAGHVLNIRSAEFMPERIAIYDLTGKELINQRVFAENEIITINIGMLKSGMYVLRVIGAEEQNIQKFIKE